MRRKKRKYGRRKRKRGRRRSRSMRSVARSVVRKEMRKNIEMKFAASSIPQRNITNVSDTVGSIPSIAQGVNANQRLGNKVQMKRWQFNVLLKGQDAGTPGVAVDQAPCFVRMIIMYAKGNVIPAAVHMIPAWNEHIDWHSIDKQNRGFVVFDKVFQLGKQATWTPSGGPTGVTAFTAQCTNTSKCYRYIKFNRKCRFDVEYNGGVYTGGNFHFYLASNKSVDPPTFEAEGKIWYTDA